jgi:hypothetical protein
MYRSGSVEPGRKLLAMNFLMDRSAENWAKEFAKVRGDVGQCRTDSPVTPTGALSGTFRWECDKGALEGTVLLAPTDPAGIQAFRYTVLPARP